MSYFLLIKTRVAVKMIKEAHKSSRSRDAPTRIACRSILHHSSLRDQVQSALGPLSEKEHMSVRTHKAGEANWELGCPTDLAHCLNTIGLPSWTNLGGILSTYTHAAMIGLCQTGI